MSKSPFRLRVRIGEMEVELGGAREEVISTLDDLNGIIDKVSEAFKVESRNLARKSEPLKAQSTSPVFPRIPRTTQCSEAVVSLLSTEWGKTPRTISELREAMEANAIFFPKTTLSGVLVWLVKKGKIRRWKDKKRGYLYVLNEEGG
ncbi:MAG: hypothetical protein ACE5OO_00985 [Candidatus Bathyarchaeia archaeon]